MYIKYKTHNTVYTQHNHLNKKNTLQYASSHSEARDLLKSFKWCKINATWEWVTFFVWLCNWNY